MDIFNTTNQTEWCQNAMYLDLKSIIKFKSNGTHYTAYRQGKYHVSPNNCQITDSGMRQEIHMLVMNSEHNTKKILTYDDEPFPGTCECNVYLMLISNEAEVLLAPAKSRVRLYPVIRK